MITHGQDLLNYYALYHYTRARNLIGILNSGSFKMASNFVNLSRKNSSAAINGASGMSSKSAANSCKISSIRRKKMDYADENGDFNKPLSNIIDEEMTDKSSRNYSS